MASIHKEYKRSTKKTSKNWDKNKHRRHKTSQMPSKQNKGKINKQQHTTPALT
jgi:hypothetical protein